MLTLALLIAQASVIAQQPTSQRPQATFETQSTIVLLDVVVRDRKGRPVRDLEPGELQVFEDGIAWSRQCHQRLADAERKVEMLLKTDKEELTQVAFDLEEGGEEA